MDRIDELLELAKEPKFREGREVFAELVREQDLMTSRQRALFGHYANEFYNRYQAVFERRVSLGL